jgi:hypothetical protein
MKSGSTVYRGVGLGIGVFGFLGAVAGLAFLGHAGCTASTERYCCDDEAACGAAVKTCDSPEYPWCDITGAFGTARTCIPNPFDGGSGCVNNEGCTATAPVCSEAHACVGCGGDEAVCTGYTDTPHCGEAGACVACRTSADCLDVDAPFCAPESATCRACAIDAECASDVCDADSGRCADADDVLYVDGVNGAAGDCTQDAPCKTIQEAVVKAAGDRFTIKVAPGDYMETVSVTGKFLVLLGKGASVQPSALNMPAVSVTGSSTAPTELHIEGLRVHDAGGNGNADGLQCAAGAATSAPKVKIQDAELDGNASQGLESSGCDVEVTRSHLHDNAGGGIKVTNGAIEVTRAQIVNNAGGGLSVVSDADFILVNNIIAKNGSPSTLFGGVRLSGTPPSGAAGVRFEFNTITGNTAQAGFTTGVTCSLLGVPTAMKNNIVYGNPVAGAGKQVTDGENCSWSYSNIGPGTNVGGTGNLNSAPAFVSESTADFHLATGSAGIDAADPGSHDVAVDIDGDARPTPADGRSDMGADELP